MKLKPFMLITCKQTHRWSKCQNSIVVCRVNLNIYKVVIAHCMWESHFLLPLFFFFFFLFERMRLMKRNIWIMSFFILALNWRDFSTQQTTYNVILTLLNIRHIYLLYLHDENKKIFSFLSEELIANIGDLIDVSRWTGPDFMLFCTWSYHWWNRFTDSNGIYLTI